MRAKKKNTLLGDTGDSRRAARGTLYLLPCETTRRSPARAPSAPGTFCHGGKKAILSSMPFVFCYTPTLFIYTLFIYRENLCSNSAVTASLEELKTTSSSSYIPQLLTLMPPLPNLRYVCMKPAIRVCAALRMRSAAQLSRQYNVRNRAVGKKVRISDKKLGKQ